MLLSALTVLILRLKEVQLMANALMMRYAASRGRRNEMNGEMMAGPAQPNRQVGTMQRMAEDREYRGNRRSEAPWSEGEAEMRYRGEDGRYKAGTRRNYYGNKRSWEFTVEPSNYQVTEPGREHLDPYEPDTPPHVVEQPMHERENRYSRMDDYDDPSGRVIGFGMPRNHYGKNDHMHQEMQRGSHSMKHHQPFDQETAEEWVDNMENEDQRQPKGGKWEPEFLKTMAQKLGVPTEGHKFWEFYAMTNAMYSDYSEVLKKYNATNPMCFAEMAKAFMDDKDAEDDKVARYYEYIVRK